MSEYIGIAVCLVLAGGISGAMVLLASWLGEKKPSAVKLEPFECGEKPFSLPGGKLAIKFYLTAILFILFDVELVAADATEVVGGVGPRSAACAFADHAGHRWLFAEPPEPVPCTDQVGGLDEVLCEVDPDVELVEGHDRPPGAGYSLFCSLSLSVGGPTTSSLETARLMPT